MTDGEKRLWQELRQFKKLYGIHFRRQVPIGAYIVDFAALKEKIIVEVDGEHHFTNTGLANDAKRDKALTELGYRVFRINTGELSNNLNGCVETLLHELGQIK